jgi:hypothetical protein
MGMTGISKAGSEMSTKYEVTSSICLLGDSGKTVDTYVIVYRGGVKWG